MKSPNSDKIVLWKFLWLRRSKAEGLAKAYRRTHKLAHGVQYWQNWAITKLLPHWTRSLCQVIINSGSCQARNPHMASHIDVCCPLGLGCLAVGTKHEEPMRDWAALISHEFNCCCEDVTGGTSMSCHLLTHQILHEPCLEPGKSKTERWIWRRLEEISAQTYTFILFMYFINRLIRFLLFLKKNRRNIWSLSLNETLLSNNIFFFNTTNTTRNDIDYNFVTNNYLYLNLLNGYKELKMAYWYWCINLFPSWLCIKA